MEKYTKTVVGFVTQHFEKKGEKFICTSQDFIAGDQINHEDESGEEIEDMDLIEEVYFPFEMVQPDNG
jgi:hypothetical protein